MHKGGFPVSQYRLKGRHKFTGVIFSQSILQGESQRHVKGHICTLQRAPQVLYNKVLCKVPPGYYEDATTLFEIEEKQSKEMSRSQLKRIISINFSQHL